MILCDVNLWLALALSGHAHHEAARNWLDSVERPASIQFIRQTQQGLLRLLTTAAVLKPYGNAPLTNREAWAVYDALVGDDRITFRAAEPSGLEETWRQLADRRAASPKLWMDTYLAAYARCADLMLVTTDAAFNAFPGARPLVLPS